MAEKRGSALSRLKINFGLVKDMTLGEVFGKKPVPATQIMKSIWVLIKKKGLRVDKK